MFEKLTPWLLFLAIFSSAALAVGEDRFRLIPIEQSSGKPVACRVHLKDSAGKPVLPAGFPSWKDHFVVPGETSLELAPGKYTYEIERGPEYASETGEFTFGTNSAPLRVELKRLTDMAARGWWSGELHVHRPPTDIEVLMQAEDLHVAPVITWWRDRNYWTSHPLPADPLVRFDGNRFYHLMAGEDEREGGALLYFNLPRPLAFGHMTREYPSPMKFLVEAKKIPGTRVDIEKPFWWDVPVWLASGLVDTIGIANNHMDRSQMSETEAWGKPRDATRLPPPLGNGYWTQEIYYQILNCGLRIAPSAGSASGVLPNPLGYNRAYVHVDGELTYEKWWEGLCAGRSFVTNGPMLIVTANDQLPGQVFQSPAGKEVAITLKIELISRDAIQGIEIIKDGKIEQTLPATAKTANVKFPSSGWMLVRAIADNRKTFRFASTAPLYVEIGKRPRRISRSAAQFFLDWVGEREQRIKLADPEQLREVREPFTMARKFWHDLVDKADAE